MLDFLCLIPNFEVGRKERKKPEEGVGLPSRGLELFPPPFKPSSLLFSVLYVLFGHPISEFGLILRQHRVHLAAPRRHPGVLRGPGCDG